MSQKRKKGGAPSKLTPELIEKITNYIRGGAYIETAAAACGIDKGTFYDWMKVGANSRSGLRYELNHAVSIAMAESEVRDLAAIDKAAIPPKSGEYLKDKEGKLMTDDKGNPIVVLPLKPDWKAAAWRLERKNPKRWGARQTLEHVGQDGGPILSADLTPDQVGELKAEISRLRAANDDSDDV